VKSLNTKDLSDKRAKAVRKKIFGFDFFLRIKVGYNSDD